jgi:hypothetical protein
VALRFAGTAAHTLIVDRGASFYGGVTAAGSKNTLILASAAGTGTVSGIGGSYSYYGYHGFNSVIVAKGASWALEGQNSITGNGKLTVQAHGALAVVSNLVDTGQNATIKGALAAEQGAIVALDNGLLMKPGSVLAVTGPSAIEIGAGGGSTGAITVNPTALLIGAGTIEGAVIDSGGIRAEGGRLTLDNAVSGSGTLTLIGVNEIVAFGAPSSVSGTIAGLTSGDTLDLLGFKAAGVTVVGHTLTANSSGGAVHLTFAGSYTGANFTFGTDHHGGTNLTFV